MKNLVVGQKVQMRSGSLSKEAVVTEITAEYIEATPTEWLGEMPKVIIDPFNRPWKIAFQKDGKQFTFAGLAARTGSKRIDCNKHLGNLGVYEWICGGWGRLDPHPLCGEGHNPWELEFSEPKKETGPDESGPVAN